MTSTPSTPSTPGPAGAVSAAGTAGTSGTAGASPGAIDRYLAPDRFNRRVLNPVVAGLVRVGVSVWGARILHVRGRSSGEWRTTPVNLLELDGATYLVAPRGHTQWVRNLRVAGGGRLQVGRRRQGFTATELADADKPPVLRAYLERWGFEIGRFVEGLDASSSDAELAAAAAGFPVFRVELDQNVAR